MPCSQGVFEIYRTLEPNAVDAFTTLRHAIILAVEHLVIDLITAVLFEGPFDDIPGVATVVTQHSSHILEDEYLRLALYDHSREFTEQCASCVLKSATLATH